MIFPLRSVSASASGPMTPSGVTPKGNPKPVAASLVATAHLVRAGDERLADRGDGRISGGAETVAGVDLVGVEQHFGSVDGHEAAARARVRHAGTDRVGDRQRRRTDWRRLRRN